MSHQKNPENLLLVVTSPQIFFNPLFHICTIFLFTFRNLINEADGETLTVVFHAILSKKFELDDGTTIVIRGDEPVFTGWEEGGVPIDAEE